MTCLGPAVLKPREVRWNRGKPLKLPLGKVGKRSLMWIPVSRTRQNASSGPVRCEPPPEPPDTSKPTSDSLPTPSDTPNPPPDTSPEGEGLAPLTTAIWRAAGARPHPL